MTIREVVAMVLASPTFKGDLMEVRMHNDFEGATVALLHRGTITEVTIKVFDDGHVEIHASNPQ